MQLDLVPVGATQAGVGAGAGRLTDWAPQCWQVAAGWEPVTARFLASPDGHGLGRFIRSRLDAGAHIYPREPFRALELTPLTQVKVVILAQDPYHGAGQAQGLAFSVAPGVRIPPSLRNILTEVDRDCGSGAGNVTASAGAQGGGPGLGNLERWARQGVLLLNTCLTVEQGLSGAHANRGWERLTDALVESVIANGRPVVFMLWGAHAQSKAGLLMPSPGRAPNLTLSANHPSPLSARRPPRPFLGCGHFSLANAFLLRHGLGQVNW